MKHDQASEQLQNDLIRRLAHACASAAAAAGDMASCREANAVVQALNDAEAAPFEGTTGFTNVSPATSPEPVAIVHDVTEADAS